MKSAVIYARFSSDKQNEESIEAQERACKEYAEKHGINITAIYIDEAISGKGSKTALRREYQRMLRDCEKGLFDTILIHKYDRVARNLGEHVNLNIKLDKLGVTLIAVAQEFGSGPEAKIMRALMWSMSEYYLDNLASETRKGLRETALKGLHNGGYPPFGYDVVDRHYVINELEASYVKKIFTAVLERKGFSDIIAELAACGIKGKRGKPIKYTQIYEILRNEKYTGVYAYSPEEEKARSDRRSKPNAIKIENALPIIIDKAMFEEAQRIMSERKQSGRRAGYLCSGLIYCECGAKMHAQKSSRKGHDYIYYACSQRCGAPFVRMEVVDKAATDYLHALLSDANNEKIVTALKIYKGSENERKSDFYKIRDQRINEKQTQYDALITNMSSGALPPEVLGDIGRKLQQLKDEIESLRTAEPPEDYTADQVKSWLSALRQASDDKAIHLLVERIDIKNKTDISVTSKLTSVLGIIGCGRPLHILPEILFLFKAYKR